MCTGYTKVNFLMSMYIEAAVHKYIEFYNNRRIQKKLTYLSPVQYRKKVCA
ncbi:IS3 family transposase [Geobacillus sp. TFV-3]|uniref:IS3 family transposase n=1 Tax=Geobacillus sp. TFV-3 TaxID=1897059 RepID=UPI00387EB4A6